MGVTSPAPGNQSEQRECFWWMQLGVVVQSESNRCTGIDPNLVLIQGDPIKIPNNDPSHPEQPSHMQMSLPANGLEAENVPTRSSQMQILVIINPDSSVIITHKSKRPPQGRFPLALHLLRQSADNYVNELRLIQSSWTIG